MLDARLGFVSLLACISCCHGAPTRAQGEPAFHYGSDPATAIVTVTFDGRKSGPPPTYTLYASGRFEHRYQKIRTGTDCSMSEIEDLLSLLARSGLLDLEAKELDRRLVERGGSPLKDSYSDAPRVTIRVSLDRYSYQGVTRAPFEKTIEVWYSGLESQLFPDVPALVGSEAFVKKIFALSKRTENRG